MTDIVTVKRSNRARTRAATAQAQRALERLGLKPATIEPLRRGGAVEFIRLYRGVTINQKQLQRWVRQTDNPGESPATSN
jgi:hypothetical protein